MKSFKERWEHEVNIPELLLSLGVELEAEGLEDTPKRVAKAWTEFLHGYTIDAEDVLKRTFEAEGEGIVLCRNIEFTSICEHHLVPFFGTCHIGYVPNKCVVGLSKLARLVECYSQRLQIQERLVQQICDAINVHLQPKSVLVIAQAKHLCCLGRGIKRTKMDFVCTSQTGQIDSALYTILIGGS